MSAPLTSIGQLGVEVRVPNGAQAVARDALDPGTPLREAMQRALGALDHVDEGVVWVIRRLHVTASVSLAVAGDDVARGIAGVIAAAIACAVEAGPGPDVVRFADRAEYAAAFAHALAEHRGDAWFFAPFRDLRLLRPLPAIVASAAREGVAVVDVLGRLHHTGVLNRVLAAARPEEQERLWYALAADAAGTEPSPVEVEAATSAVAAAVDHGVSSAAAVALAALGGVAARGGDAPPGLVVALDRVARTDVVRLHPLSTGAPEPGRSPPHAPTATPVLGFSDGVPSTTPGAPIEQTENGTRAARLSNAACAFMLLSSLEFAGVPTAVTPVAASVRRRVLALALGLGESSDDALTLASGSDRTQLERISAEEASSWIADAARRDGRPPATTVVVETLDNVPLTLVRDAHTGLWWSVAKDAAEAVALARGIHGDHLDVIDAPADWRPADADAAWFELTPDTDIGEALLARAVLTRFAARLFGFERASCGYLVERFLVPPGVVTADPAAVLVELPRPPLHVVLSMAGLDAFSIELPWIERTILVSHEAGR